MIRNMTYPASTIQRWVRGLTTNHVRLETESPDPLLRPLTLPRRPDEVAQLIESWIDAEPQWSLESRQDAADGITLHLTHRTRTIRFVDDVHVRLLADGESTKVEAESRSRIGKGDLGQNPRNLRELVGALRDDG